MAKAKTVSKFCIVVFVIVSILATACAVSVAAVYFADNPFDITIMSDVHVLSENQLGDSVTASLEAQQSKGQKMLIISEALLNEAMDKVIAEKSEVLLIAGDLTDDGGKASHVAVAKALKRAEDGGVKCFVINGNHDILNKAKDYSEEIAVVADNVDAEEFAEIYADFGYDEALSRDRTTLSYVAELNDNYRLFAIDCCNYEKNESGYVDNRNTSVMRDATLAWIKDNLTAAKEAKKEVVAMIHYPITTHLTDFTTGEDYRAASADKISKLFYEYGVEYVFSGHLHNNDIATLQNKSGQTICEIETSALSNYPMAMRRYEDDGKTVSLTTSYLDSVKAEYLPRCISAETRAEITADLLAYSVKIVNDGMLKKVFNKLDLSLFLKLLSVFGLDKSAASTISLANDIRENLLLDFFNLPLYEEVDGGDSLSGICAKYGVNLPSSDYNTVWELAMHYVRAVYKGNESTAADSKEGVLLKYTVYAALYKVDEFGLFEKISALNPGIAVPQLSEAMIDLFNEGKLDVVNTELLSAVCTVPVIARLKERFEDVQIVGGMLKNLDLTDSAAIMSFAKDLLELATTLDMDWSKLIGNAGSYVDMIMDMEPNRFFDFDNGDVNLGLIIDKLAFGKLGNNLIVDDGTDDNTLIVQKIAE